MSPLFRFQILAQPREQGPNLNHSDPEMCYHIESEWWGSPALWLIKSNPSQLHAVFKSRKTTGSFIFLFFLLYIWRGERKWERETPEAKNPHQKRKTPERERSENGSNHPSWSPGSSRHHSWSGADPAAIRGLRSKISPIFVAFFQKEKNKLLRFWWFAVFFKGFTEGNCPWISQRRAAGDAVSVRAFRHVLCGTLTSRRARRTVRQKSLLRFKLISWVYWFLKWFLFESFVILPSCIVSTSQIRRRMLEVGY